jgi:hypothetical protein
MGSSSVVKLRQIKYSPKDCILFGEWWGFELSGIAKRCDRVFGVASETKQSTKGILFCE